MQQCSTQVCIVSRWVWDLIAKVRVNGLRSLVLTPTTRDFIHEWETQDTELTGLLPLFLERYRDVLVWVAYLTNRIATRERTVNVRMSSIKDRFSDVNGSATSSLHEKNKTAPLIYVLPISCQVRLLCSLVQTVKNRDNNARSVVGWFLIDSKEACREINLQ